MKVVVVSEHYYPRVGGTVNYVSETLSALVSEGVDVELWVPGPAPTHWLKPKGVLRRSMFEKISLTILDYRFTCDPTALALRRSHS